MTLYFFVPQDARVIYNHKMSVLGRSLGGAFILQLLMSLPTYLTVWLWLISFPWCSFISYIFCKLVFRLKGLIKFILFLVGAGGEVKARVFHSWSCVFPLRDV